MGPIISGNFPCSVHVLVVIGGDLTVEFLNFTFGDEGARLLTGWDEDEGGVLRVG